MEIPMYYAPYENTIRQTIGYVTPLLEFIGEVFPVFTKKRIKEPESMIEKLKRRGIEATPCNAMTKVNDAIGFRIICPYEDIYPIAAIIRYMDDFEVIKEKDYIKHPKQCGYRSYHLIVKCLETGQNIEIQIRTKEMDILAEHNHEAYKTKAAN